MAIPKEISKEHVLAALKYIDKNDVPNVNKSYRYDLVVTKDGKRKTYPPKYVIAVARHLAIGGIITTNGFNAIEAKNKLRHLEFDVAAKKTPKSIPSGDITEESDKSRAHQLDTEVVSVPIRVKKNHTVERKVELVKLTLDNVAKVEAMIQNDSAYIRASKSDAGPDFNSKGTLEYSGATPFWMSLLREALEDRKWTPTSKYGKEYDRKDKIGFTFDEILAGAIVAVDRDNSTHLTGDGVGRIEIWGRIRTISREELRNRLLKRDFTLIDEIMKETDPGSKDKRDQLNADAKKWFSPKHDWLLKAIEAKVETKKQDKEFKARTNQSFASKFCHYACLYIFEGKEESDNFSIYDKILETVLPWYWNRFEVELEKEKETRKFNYQKYSDVIDEIRDKNKQNTNGYLISRNGLDHLLWYYHKGRLNLDQDIAKDL